MASRTPSATRVRWHSGVPLSGAEPVPAASEAEVPRSLEVGTDPCMTLTDLGSLQVGVKCSEHRSMSFLSRVGTLVGARDDAPIRRRGRRRRRAVSHRQVASGHTARGAWPAIFTLVSNIDMGTSFRVDGHDDAPTGCRSSEFRHQVDEIDEAHGRLCAPDHAPMKPRRRPMGKYDCTVPERIRRCQARRASNPRVARHVARSGRGCPGR
jgi:hypothetical protein